MSEVHDLLNEYDALAAQVPYGKVFVTLSHDQDKVRSAHATWINSIGKYKDNTTARAAINKIIDNIEAEKKSGGAISITVHPMNGILSQVTVQSSERKSFQY